MLLAGVLHHGDETFAAADGFDREPAPELEAAVDLERLPAVDRHEADALLAHPVERVEASRHQQLAQIGIGAELGDARHVVEELILRVGAEIGAVDFRLREIGDQRLDVVDAVIDDAHGARGEAAVAAGFFVGRGFEHEHGGALLARGERGAIGGVAAADDDDVVLFHAISDPRLRFLRGPWTSRADRA